jgi:hypothetical protein
MKKLIRNQAVKKGYESGGAKELVFNDSRKSFQPVYRLEALDHYPKTVNWGNRPPELVLQ